MRVRYKAHIVAEPETGLFTNAAFTQAGGSGSGEAEAGITLLATDSSIATSGDDATGGDLPRDGVDAGDPDF